MTSDSAHAGDDPRRLLANARELARRVRKDQRATWFPLLVLALATFAAIPAYRFGGHHLGTCVTTGPDRRLCTVYSNAEFVYWPIALVLAYGAIAAFYIHRSRVRGIETPIRAYAVAGIVIALAVTAIALWGLHHLAAHDLTGLNGALARLVSAAAAIGLGLLVLAWAERNRALLVLTAAYLVIVLAPVTFGWTASGLSQWFYGPALVIHGGVLLLGGIGFALAQRPLRATSP